MPIATTLSEQHQAAVRRMLASGKDPLDIRAIFRAVPERSNHAKTAFDFATSFTEVEVHVLRDLRSDEEEERQEHRRLRIEAQKKIEERRQARLATITEIETDGPQDEQPAAEKAPKRKQIEGVFVTALIRWMAAHGFQMDQVGPCLADHLDEPIHPATMQIQFKKGLKKEGIPEIPPSLAKSLKQKKKVC